MSEKFATIDQMVEELNKEMNKINETLDNTDFNRSKNLLALIKKELEAEETVREDLRLYGRSCMCKCSVLV